VGLDLFGLVFRIASISLVQSPPEDGVPVEETEYSLRFGLENVVEGWVWGEEVVEEESGEEEEEVGCLVGRF